MEIRELPRSEWYRLQGTLLEGVAGSLSPCARVLVQEEDGLIVRCIALDQVWHLECAWVAPAYRGSIRGGRMFVRRLRDLIGSLGIREVWSMAFSDAARRLCGRFGDVIELDHCQHVAIQVKR